MPHMVIWYKCILLGKNLTELIFKDDVNALENGLQFFFFLLILSWPNIHAFSGASLFLQQLCNLY